MPSRVPRQQSSHSDLQAITQDVLYASDTVQPLHLADCWPLFCPQDYPKKKKKSTYRREDRLYAHSINTPEYMNMYNPTQVHIYSHKLSVHNSVSQASAIDTEQRSHK